MITKSVVKKNSYRDSLILMRVSTQLRSISGVANAEVMVATEQNKKTLRSAGLWTDEVEGAGSTDLVIVVKAQTEQVTDEAVHLAEEILAGRESSCDTHELRTVRTLMAAREVQPDSSIAVLSIPGELVKREAMKALDLGLNLLIFSSNVPVEDELEIKETAARKGLLVMGPDCGTAVIDGAALAFANKVRKGRIGLVGASGTGLQEVMSLIHRCGQGITHAIGTGSNDIGPLVGGLTMCEGIRRLEADPETDVIVIVSKPPDPSTADVVLGVAGECKKPVIVNFLGGNRSRVEASRLALAETLEDAALMAVAKVRGEEYSPSLFTQPLSEVVELAASHYRKLSSCQKYIRGLFSGGTFTSEALLILRSLVSPLYSNSRLAGVGDLPDARKSMSHTCVDLGDEEFVLGKPHPMLEPAMRRDRLMQEAQDPEVAVILLDFVLGYGAHADPVGGLLPALQGAIQAASAQGRHIAVVASVCGTDQDPQQRDEQVRKLEDLGAVVMPSNAQAARMAALIATRGAVERIADRGSVA